MCVGREKVINLESRDWSLEAGRLGNAGPLIPTPLARCVSRTFSVRGRAEEFLRKP